MIQDLPVEETLKTALSRGGDLSEIFLESSHSLVVTCDNNRIDKIASADDTGLGLRLIHDTKTAYGSTNNLNKDSLLDLANTLNKVSNKTEKSDIVLSLVEKPHPSKQTVKNHPRGISIEKKVELVERANKIARDLDKRIVQVKAVLKEHLRNIWIIASDGSINSDEQVFVSFLIQVISSDGKTLQTSYEPLGGTRGYEIFEDTPPEEIALTAANRALVMLTAAPAPSGTMPVVLDGNAGGTMIHEAVGHGLEADLAQEGLSVYSNRLNEKVASHLISVYDDPTIAGFRGSFTFDDEGSEVNRTCLIENGILKKYMQNKISAARSGLASTGNGRRENYTFPPLVRMSNTMIAPSSDKKDEIISSTERGLYVKKMGGGQVNTVNGDFVFEIQEGYRIEHGKIGEPVRGATLTGNGPCVLETIDRVGDDLGFSIGTCGKNGQGVPVSCGQPTIRIPEIIVGGKDS